MRQTNRQSDRSLLSNAQSWPYAWPRRYFERQVEVSERVLPETIPLTGTALDRAAQHDAACSISQPVAGRPRLINDAVDGEKVPGVGKEGLEGNF